MKLTKKVLIIVLSIIATALLAFAKVPGKSMVQANALYSHPGYEGFEVHYQTYPTFQRRLF